MTKLQEAIKRMTPEQCHPGVKFWMPELSNVTKGNAEIGKGTVVHAGVHIHDQVVIGKNCQIEAMAFIPNGVTIEDEVFIGPGVIFTNDPKLSERESFVPAETLVKKGAKIGAGAMIRAGITIGEHAKIGMGSVVLNDIPANEIWVGNPARKIVNSCDHEWKQISMDESWCTKCSERDISMY